MTDAEAKEAMRAMGKACGGVLDDILAEVLRSGATFQVKYDVPRTREARYDALMHPASARDYGESMTAEEFLAECKIRGIKPPAWWPIKETK